MEIGIYGLGRFGTFWGKELSRYATVKGYNRTPLKEAPAGMTLVSREEVLECETIIFCVAISALEPVLQEVASSIKEGATVMDTCSVKVYPAQVMERLLPEGINIIATHPMFGPDSGKDGLKGLPLVFSPLRGSDELFSRWRELFVAMELNLLEMSCDAHDREAAYSQGVTHFVGRVLDELALKPTEIATLGYQRLLSIIEQTCNDPLQLFLDLQRFNPYAPAMQQRLKASLDKVLALLAQQEGEQFKLQ